MVVVTRRFVMIDQLLQATELSAKPFSVSRCKGRHREAATVVAAHDAQGAGPGLGGAAKPAAKEGLSGTGRRAIHGQDTKDPILPQSRFRYTQARRRCHPICLGTSVC